MVVAVTDDVAVLDVLAIDTAVTEIDMLLLVVVIARALDRKAKAGDMKGAPKLVPLHM
jgi:hypothetical protein